MPIEPDLIPSITEPLPITADPDDFDARADLAWTELNPAIAGINDAAAKTFQNAEEVFEAATDIAAAADVAADPAGYVGKSNTPLTVVAGNKDITLTAARANLLTPNRQVVIVLDSDPSIKMFGTIAGAPAPTSTTARVVVVSGGVFGAGSYSGWKIIDAAFYASSATPAELWAGDSDVAVLTPKSLRDAKAWVPLVDGATVTPDGDNGRNFTWTIGGNRTLGAITNCGVNDTFLLQIMQDGIGSRLLAWATGVYYRAGGPPVLSTTPGAKDYLQLRVITVNGAGTATYVLATFLRNPTNA